VLSLSKPRFFPSFALMQKKKKIKVERTVPKGVRGRIFSAVQLTMPAAWFKQRRFLYPMQRLAHDPLAEQAFMPIFSVWQWYTNGLQNTHKREEERTRPKKYTREQVEVQAQSRFAG
jgi:hypothetical protein